jgi:hypothetical protein
VEPLAPGRREGGRGPGGPRAASAAVADAVRAAGFRTVRALPDEPYRILIEARP